MKDFSDVLLCSDFDGTLFTGGKISDEDAEAILKNCIWEED